MNVSGEVTHPAAFFCSVLASLRTLRNNSGAAWPPKQIPNLAVAFRHQSQNKIPMRDQNASGQRFKNVYL